MTVAGEPALQFAMRIGAAQRVHLRVGELEERQRAAVGQAEEGMAELDLAVEVAAEGFLAPGRDQGDTEQILEKAAIGLVILDHIGVVMKAKRQLPEQLRLARGCSLD